MNTQPTSIILLALFVAACGDSAQRSGSTARDSAGISIVESRKPVWTEATAWRVDTNPLLRIGTVQGDSNHQLFRVGGAGKLSDGTIVVANGGSQEVRWFDPKGRFLRNVGRQGEGPGEYRGMRSLLMLAGDSVLVEDGLRDRMNLYSSTGDLVRSWTIQPLRSPFDTPPPIGRLADGAFVAFTRGNLSEPPGLVEDRGTLVQYHDGQAADTLAQFPGGESYYVRCGPNNTAVCNASMPYMRGAYAAAGPQRVYAGNGQRYEIRAYEAGGALQAVYRRVAELQQVTQNDVQRYVEEILTRMRPERRPEWRRHLESAPHPERFPAFDALRVDATGHLWVERFDRGQEPVRTWDVFGPDGRWLGSLALPRGLTVMQIGDDFVLGVTRDENDVEYVTVRRLGKGN